MRKLYLENFEYSNYVFFNNKFYMEKEIEGDKEEILKRIANINSKNLKSIENIKISNNTTTYLEEYINGYTLDEINIENLTFNQMLVILKDILEAMKDLHGTNIIHRDIKPENIIITKNNNAILIDYNIARIFDGSKNKDTTLYGTEYYASPEQYGSIQTSFSSDIYSFGKTIKEVFKDHKDYSKIRNIINKCLEFDPNNRYKNVEEILNILDSGEKSNNKAFKVISIVLLLIGVILEFEKSIIYAADNNINNVVLYLDVISIIIVSFILVVLLFKLKIFNKQSSILKLVVNEFIFLFLMASFMVLVEAIFSLIIKF